MRQFPFRTFIFLLWFQILPLLAFSQLLKEKKEYTRYDSLLGTITPMRAYDVTYYKLNLDIDLEKKNMSGMAMMEFITLDRIRFRKSVLVVSFVNIDEIKIIFSFKQKILSKKAATIASK